MNFDYEIEICLGSSCFSRGNKKVLRVIGKYLKDNNLEDRVFFHGAHCFSSCDKGPIVKINGVIYEYITEEKIIPILNEVFGIS